MPGPPAPLLHPPDQQRLETQPAPDDQGPGPGGPAELVGAHRDQVGVEAGQVEVDVAAGGGGVHVDRHPGRTAERPPPRPPAGPCPPRGWPTGSARAPAGARRGGPGPRPAPPGRSGPGRRRGGARRRPAARRRRAHSECSTAAQSTAAPGRARVAPQTAALAASVPPEVKTTWRGRTPSSAATCPRASSRTARTARPSSWTRPGSPAGPASARRTASTASGRARGGRGVVEVVAGHRGRGLRPTGRRPAQARAAQVSSPRAREESTTGVGPSGASPQRPDKSPLTIPRSTAHSTG